MRHQKTDLGRQTFKERNLALSARQRSAFILFDGNRDDITILQSLAATGINHEDINFLVQTGLIEPVKDNNTEAGRASFGSRSGASANTNTAGQFYSEPADSNMSEQDRYKLAYPIAGKLTSGLGLKGFRLNMALEAAGSYQDLLAIAPKIREAVGDDKFAELQRALKGL